MLDLLRKRRSIRKFKRDRIDPDGLEKLKEAALRSFSSRDIKPWRFYFVLNADTIEKLSRCKEHGSSFLKNAPLAVVVCGDEGASDVWIEDCSIAAAILHLTAESLGLGGCWIQVRNRKHNSESTSEEYVRRVLNMDGTLKILSIIAIGIPDEVKAGHPLESLDRNKVIVP